MRLRPLVRPCLYGSITGIFIGIGIIMMMPPKNINKSSIEEYDCRPEISVVRKNNELLVNGERPVNGRYLWYTIQDNPVRVNGEQCDLR